MREDEVWKCWWISVDDMSSNFFATSRGRARYNAARRLRELGWASTVGEAFKKMRCHRAPEFDHEAQCYGKEAIR